MMTEMNVVANKICLPVQQHRFSGSAPAGLPSFLGLTTDSRRSRPAVAVHTTHLEVEDDGPDQAEHHGRPTLHDVGRVDVDQLYLPAPGGEHVRGAVT